MFKSCSIILAGIAAVLATPLAAWEVFQEKGDDGTTFTVAEQVGEGGHFLNLICFEKQTQIEIIAPYAVEPSDDAILFQVDGNPELLIAGFWDPIDDATSAFVGLDRRDRPAVQTQNLVRQIKAGRDLYIGDPDLGEGVERFSLRGSSRAVEQLLSQCE